MFEKWHTLLFSSVFEQKARIAIRIFLHVRTSAELEFFKWCIGYCRVFISFMVKSLEVEENFDMQKMSLSVAILFRSSSRFLPLRSVPILLTPPPGFESPLRCIYTIVLRCIFPEVAGSMHSHPYTQKSACNIAGQITFSYGSSVRARRKSYSWHVTSPGRLTPWTIFSMTG